MIKKWLLVMICSMPLGFSQEVSDLIRQFNLIQDIVPNATTVGVIWDPKSNPDLDSAFGDVSAATGLRVVKTPLNNIRELSGLLRQMTEYNISFIYLNDDRLVSSKNVIKFVVKSTKDQKIPVFCPSDSVFKSGGYGELLQAGGSWKIKINGSVKDEYPIKIPEGDENYVVVFN